MINDSFLSEDPLAPKCVRDSVNKGLKTAECSLCQICLVVSCEIFFFYVCVLWLIQGLSSRRPDVSSLGLSPATGFVFPAHLEDVSGSLRGSPGSAALSGGFPVCLGFRQHRPHLFCPIPSGAPCRTSFVIMSPASAAAAGESSTCTVAPEEEPEPGSPRLEVRSEDQSRSFGSKWGGNSSL